MNRALAVLFALSIAPQGFAAGLLSLFARHDFEIWNQEIDHRIMYADTGSGLRETPFQYDANQKVLYSLQGLYDNTGVLRFYDLAARSVKSFRIPVSRAPDYWTGVVVRGQLFMLGAGDSVTNGLDRGYYYKGRGNKLFAIPLGKSSHSAPVACLDIGKSRMCTKVMPLSDSGVCVVGLDLTVKSFFIAICDAKQLCLTNLKMLPAKWSGKDNLDLCATETKSADIALHMKIPIEVLVSPAKDRIFVIKDREFLILNQNLETEDSKICSSAEFGIKANGECCATWIDGASIVGYDPDGGNWFEYNVNKRQVVEKGRVVLESKEPDRRECIRDVLGRRRFCVSGSNGRSRVCLQDEKGQEKGKAIPRLTYLEYFPPEVIVINK